MVDQRCFVVLGVPRSGTSAVAGILHTLGVNMGEGHLQKGNQWNPQGYFEDLRWQKLNKSITGDRYGHRWPKDLEPQVKKQYRSLIRECQALSPLWGIKDPRLCFILEHLILDLPYPHLIAIHRPSMASALSLSNHSRGNYKGQQAMDLDQAMWLRDYWQDAMNHQLARWDRRPRLDLQYNTLIQDPSSQIDRIIAFVFGAQGVNAQVRQQAIRFVDPRLKHHG